MYSVLLGFITMLLVTIKSEECNKRGLNKDVQHQNEDVKHENEKEEEIECVLNKHPGTKYNEDSE